MKKPFRINIIGAPGSGKSFLAEQIFLYLKSINKYSVEIVPEWIRTEIHRIGPLETIWEQIRTTKKQRNLEHTIKADVIITDSGVTAGYFYACLHYDGKDKRQLSVLEDLYQELIHDVYNEFYNLVIYVPPIKRAHCDDARHHDHDQIEILDQHMKLIFTQVHKYGNVLELKGGVKDRFELCKTKINELLKLETV